MIRSTVYLVLFALVWQDLVAVGFDRAAQLDEDFEHPGEIIFPEVPRELANSGSVNSDRLPQIGVPFFPGIPGITSTKKVWRGISSLGGEPTGPSIRRIPVEKRSGMNWGPSLDPTGVYRSEQLEGVESVGSYDGLEQSNEQTSREVSYAAEQTTQELLELVSRKDLPELHQLVVSFANRVAQIVLEAEAESRCIQPDDEDDNRGDTDLVMGARRQLWRRNNYNSNSNANVFGRRGKTKLNENSNVSGVQ